MKLSQQLADEKTILLLGIYPRERKIHVYRKILHTQIYSSLINNIQKWKTSQVSSCNGIYYSTVKMNKLLIPVIPLPGGGGAGVLTSNT
jgi:hypothetical protein